MKPSSAKAKGRKLQNHVADRLRDLTGLDPADIKGAVMGETGIDIKLSTAAQEKVPFAFECKNQQALNIWASLKQAEANAGELTPAVVFKRNHTDVYVALKFEDFIELIRRSMPEPVC